MPHDVIARRLVLRFVGHGAERVAKRVEAEPGAAIDAEGLQELGCLFGYRAVVGIFRPAETALRDEDQAGPLPAFVALADTPGTRGSPRRSRAIDGNAAG